MTGFQNFFTLLAAAILAPIVVLALASSIGDLNRQRSGVETEAQERAGRILALVDAQLKSELSAMEVLAGSETVSGEDWASADARIDEVASDRSWRKVIIWRPDTGVEYYNSARDASRPSAEQPGLALVHGLDRNGIGDVVRGGESCPCVYLETPVPSRGDGGTDFMVTALDPNLFQGILVSHVKPDTVAALVDRNGRFIARSVDFESRVGTLASAYVRASIAAGELRGFYRGRTLEGFENYTAYQVSDISGWSVHIAVDSELVAGPQRVAAVLTWGGALLAALVAGVLAWMAYNEYRRARARELRQASAHRLEALGQLTATVSHDFNNLLAVIQSGMNMLHKRVDDPRNRSIIEEVQRATDRGTRLVKQLLSFSGRSEGKVETVDAAALINDMRDLLRQSAGPRVQLDCRLDEAARWIRADATQLEFAILNLVINARDAMPTGGGVTITLSPAGAQWTEIQVTDTGTGMTPEILARVTEPFFTTKTDGKGTGLGLAQVHTAMRQAGGDLEIDSVVGQGSTIRLRFLAAPAPEATSLSGSDSLAAASGIAIVVDDEPGVRAYLAEILTEAGIEAREAASGEAALALLKENPANLIVTDFDMPGMSGLEIAAAARRLEPSVRVVVVTGRPDSRALADKALIAAVVAKPFEADDLLQAIRGALSEKPGATAPPDPPGDS